jgi:hypothetical protein
MLIHCLSQSSFFHSVVTQELAGCFNLTSSTTEFIQLRTVSDWVNDKPETIRKEANVACRLCAKESNDHSCFRRRGFAVKNRCISSPFSCLATGWYIWVFRIVSWKGCFCQSCHETVHFLLVSNWYYRLRFSALFRKHPPMWVVSDLDLFRHTAYGHDVTDIFICSMAILECLPFTFHRVSPENFVGLFAWGISPL